MAVFRRVAALVGAAGVSLAAFSGVATAEDTLTWSATATGTSDYVFRGVSQTQEDPTIQGSLGIGYGLFYAGIWATGVDFGPGDDAQIEADYYAGIKPTWGPVTFDFGFIYYDYPGYSQDIDVLELKAGVSGEIYKGLAAGGTLYYSPDYNDFEYVVYEGTLGYTLPTFHIFTPTVSGVVGHYDFDGGGDYTYWNAGLALAVEKLTFDFRYWDTDIPASDLADERFVFSLTLALP